jgi:hypothetical protein
MLKRESNVLVADGGIVPQTSSSEQARRIYCTREDRYDFR